MKNETAVVHLDLMMCSTVYRSLLSLSLSLFPSSINQLTWMHVKTTKWASQMIFFATFLCNENGSVTNNFPIALQVKGLIDVKLNGWEWTTTTKKVKKKMLLTCRRLAKIQIFPARIHFILNVTMTTFNTF